MLQAVVAILKASDVAVTVGWYRRAGFEVRRQEPSLSEVSRGGLTLQFLSGDTTPWAGPPALTACFYVHVADVDTVAGELQGKVDMPWCAEDREWGRRELVVRDPDGYFITFTAPRDSAEPAQERRPAAGSGGSRG